MRTLTAAPRSFSRLCCARVLERISSSLSLGWCGNSYAVSRPLVAFACMPLVCADICVQCVCVQQRIRLSWRSTTLAPIQTSTVTTGKLPQLRYAVSVCSLFVVLLPAFFYGIVRVTQNNCCNQTAVEEGYQRREDGSDSEALHRRWCGPPGREWTAGPAFHKQEEGAGGR